MVTKKTTERTTEETEETTNWFVEAWQALREMDDRFWFYVTLGVGTDASLQHVHWAYRQLAKRYHPDVSKAEAIHDIRSDRYISTTEKFLQVQKAYEAICAEITEREMVASERETS
jgi:preprotein translocase subunit Sec63